MKSETWALDLFVFIRVHSWFQDSLRRISR
jgi:hypothetical protein